jgi:AcrR family transcriptional regulator
MPPKTPKTERNAETRKRILDAAAVLFARYGLRATTLADIGSRARLGKATLYHYFPDGKASIFEQAVGSIVDAIWDQVEAKVRAAGHPYQQLLAYIWLRIEAFDREMMVRGLEPEVWAEIRPVAEQALAVYFQRERDLLRELIEAAVAHGGIRECRVDLAVRVLQAALKGLTSDGPLDTTTAQRRRDTQEFIDFLGHGFLPR